MNESIGHYKAIRDHFVLRPSSVEKIEQDDFQDEDAEEVSDESSEEE